jgi:periplasmic protein TonB
MLSLSRGVHDMRSWFRARSKSQETVDETLIRVCLVSRDAALVEEVHKDLLIGFSTRGGYDFESDHPDFQQYCDVLFVDLRAAGVQGDPRDGLAFIDAIRKSVSHPPIVALCDSDATDFAREVMQRGAYERLTAPLKMPQLRLALQRAYEFRLAEAKLENFLTQQTATHENPRTAPKRKARPAARAAAAAPRPVRRSRPVAPSRLAVGFVLGCVLFFAGLVAVRTILSGMGDALASAGFAADPGTAPSGGALAGEPHSNSFSTSHFWPLTATSEVGKGALDPASAHPFREEAELAAPARLHSSLPGYEPAAIIERITPRYSLEARAQHLQGTVRIRAVIGKDGVPRGLARVSGDPLLAQIAMDAVALWRYAPATVDGEPVESEVIIPIDFHLPD